MSKQKRELNPQLNVGDRVMCLHMDGETSVPAGTFGVVKSVVRDPFEEDGTIYSINWDNGSSLGLVSVSDAWIKTPEEQIDESANNSFDFFSKNPDVFEHFDYRFLRKFLLKLRDSGVINMFQSPSFLYSGREWIDRYYGENQEDNDAFQELLEMSNEARDKMIQGVISYMRANDKSLDDMNQVNRFIQQFSKKIAQMYVSFF
jgi:hypothetical protein